IPWVGARAPLPLRLGIWGLRSKTDQFLVKRLLRKRDPSARQRILPTLDLIREYRREFVIPNVRQWFSDRWILSQGFIEQTERRASLQSWPYANADIASAANISILLDICNK